MAYSPVSYPDDLSRRLTIFLYPSKLTMALRKMERQISPLRLKITLLVAGLGPLLLIGIFLQSRGFFD